MTRIQSGLGGVFVALVALVVVVSPVLANTWGNFHWARTTASFNLTVSNNLTSDWNKYLKAATVAWSDSPVVDLSVAKAHGDRTLCAPTTGTITICNAEYGMTGWLGLTSITTDDDHITSAQIKINETYFAFDKYNTDAYRNYVVCHEIGHALGLAHVDEDFSTVTNSCMDVANDVTMSQTPNADDYATLEAIYLHLDDFNSATQKRQKRTQPSNSHEIAAQSAGTNG